MHGGESEFKYSEVETKHMLDDLNFADMPNDAGNYEDKSVQCNLLGNDGLYALKVATSQVSSKGK